MKLCQEKNNKTTKQKLLFQKKNKKITIKGEIHLAFSVKKKKLFAFILKHTLCFPYFPFLLAMSLAYVTS